MTKTTYSTEQIAKTLEAALSFIDKLRLIDFAEDSLTKKATESYFQLLKDIFKDDYETYSKVGNLIDGMLLLKEYELNKLN